MNNLQTATVGSTLGIGVIVLAGTLGIAHGADEPFHRHSPRPVVRPDSTAIPAGATNWKLVTAPSEADFQSLALELAGRQEPLGEDFERILVAHFEEFLD